LIDLPEDYENIGRIWLFFRAYKKDGYSEYFIAEIPVETHGGASQ